MRGGCGVVPTKDSGCLTPDCKNSNPRFSDVEDQTQKRESGDMRLHSFDGKTPVSPSETTPDPPLPDSDGPVGVP